MRSATTRDAVFPLCSATEKLKQGADDFGSGRQNAQAELPAWALVLCTYRRREALRLCLRAALAQTRPPLEVIIVDASPDWQESRVAVMVEIARLYPNIRWKYVEAQRRSLPAQRNQGIALASAPILFMIDDDSILYRDCAEEILRVYAADRQGEIAGVGATEVAEPPGELNGVLNTMTNTTSAREDTGATISAWGKLHRLRNSLRWNVAQMFDRGSSSFLPYDGKWVDQPIPESCAPLDLTPARSFNGFRMTFRREAIERGGFLGWFVGYAPLEDLDGSHRASRHGALVNANRARLCHLTVRGGRPSHYSATAQWVMSGAVLHSVFGNDRAAMARAWRRQVNRFMLLELVRDVAKGRLTLPGFRGILHGASRLGEIYSMTPEELEQWYPPVQEKLLGRGRPLLRTS
jgi:GT2 family glycosyltransferase